MSWTVEELQRFMDEHIDGIEKYKFSPDTMDKIPDLLKEDLFSRMEYLFSGVCGDMQELEYAYVMTNGIEELELSDEQIKKLEEYHQSAYDEMSQTVLDCGNDDDADWLEMVKILFNSEQYFREQLTPDQLDEYRQNVANWEHKHPLYMPNEIFESYRLLLK